MLDATLDGFMWVLSMRIALRSVGQLIVAKRETWRSWLSLGSVYGVRSISDHQKFPSKAITVQPNPAQRFHLLHIRQCRLRLGHSFPRQTMGCRGTASSGWNFKCPLSFKVQWTWPGMNAFEVCIFCCSISAVRVLDFKLGRPSWGCLNELQVPRIQNGNGQHVGPGTRERFVAGFTGWNGKGRCNWTFRGLCGTVAVIIVKYSGQYRSRLGCHIILRASNISCTKKQR